MNHSSELRSSPEDRPSASSFHSGVPVIAVGETVLSPEGRSLSSQGSTSSSPSSPSFNAVFDSADTGLWRRLFPTDSDPVLADDIEAAAGCELGHFAIEERIGSGGMGAVFRAIDTRLQRVVALKVLSPGQSRDRSAVMRFQNEARAAARLDHENIARVHYIGEDRGLHFIAFEYVTGQNVREVIARSGRLSVADAVNDILQIAAALRHTSAAGVVHRDIKPSNIIIAASGRAKLVDLGLARKIATDGFGDLTVDGTTLGTFDYISPEQARDPRSVDVRSDIYSLGCTLYHMLTGRPPYSSGTVLQKLLDHQSGLAPDPRAVNSNVPPALSAICRKMMAGDPKNRYATPDELIRDLAAVAAKIGLRPTIPDAHIWTRPRPPVTSRVRSGFIWAGSAAIVVVLAMLVDRMPFHWTTNTGASVTSSRKAAMPVENSPEGLANAGNQNQLSSRINGVVGGSADSTQDPPDVPTNHQRTAQPTDDRTTEQKMSRSETTVKADVDGTNSSGSLSGSPMETNTASVNGTAEDNGIETPSTKSPANTEGSETANNDQTIEENRPWSNLGNMFPWLRPIVDSAMASQTPKPKPSTENLTPSLPTPSAVQATNPMVPQFAIESAGGVTTVLSKATTLSQAIEAAYDGDTIKLRFNGPLPGGPLTKPIVLSGKHITLVAGSSGNQRYAPVIEFVSDPMATHTASTGSGASETEVGMSRMFVLEGDAAGMTVEHVRFRMSVHDASRASEGRALFVLAGAGQIRLRDVAITIDSQGWPCAVFDLRRADSRDTEAVSYMMGADKESFAITMEDSFVRGTVDLVTIRHTQAGKIAIRNSGIAIEQSLLNVVGGSEIPERDEVVDVSLSHVTAVLGNPLLRVDLLEHYGYVTPVHITSSNSVYATSEAGQLIFMNGTDVTTFDELLNWKPDRNLFKGFSEYFSVQRPDNGNGFGFPSSFGDWQRNWSPKEPSSDSEQAPAPEQEIAPGDESIQLWANPGVEALQPLEFTPEDFQLNLRIPQISQIEILATDSRLLIGVDPESIPSNVEPARDETTVMEPLTIAQPSADSQP